MIKSVITDLSNNKSVHINTENGINGLVVDTRSFKKFDNTIQFFVNDIYGNNLAQNGTSIGEPTIIWNGEQGSWTASTISGNVNDFDFQSTDQVYSGINSIDCTNSKGGNIFQLENSISVQEFNVLTGWIYVTSGWNSPDDGCEIILYNTNLGAQVSENSVDLDNYINGTNTGTWQKFTIPWEDFGANNDFNALRFTMLQDGTPPNFYLDELLLVSAEGDGPLKYTITPNKNSWLYVNKFIFTYVDEYNATLADSTMPNIPYNSFFNTPYLDTGIVYQRIQGNEVIISNSINRHLDLMTFGEGKIVGTGYDGTYSWITVEVGFNEPIILKYEEDDSMQFVVSDDLSSLKEFIVNISAKTEDRSLC